MKYNTKALKSATKFHCLITSSGKIVVQSTDYRFGINVMAGDDPIPIKFGPKGTDPQ